MDKFKDINIYVASMRSMSALHFAMSAAMTASASPMRASLLTSAVLACPKALKEGH